MAEVAQQFGVYNSRLGAGDLLVAPRRVQQRLGGHPAVRRFVARRNLTIALDSGVRLTINQLEIDCGLEDDLGCVRAADIDALCEREARAGQDQRRRHVCGFAHVYSCTAL